LIDVEPEEQIPHVVASVIDVHVIPSSTVDSLSSGSLPPSVLEGKIPVSVEVTALAHGDLR
jgi:hypothetical protein